MNSYHFFFITSRIKVGSLGQVRESLRVRWRRQEEELGCTSCTWTAAKPSPETSFCEAQKVPEKKWRHFLLVVTRQLHISSRGNSHSNIRHFFGWFWINICDVTWHYSFYTKEDFFSYPLYRVVKFCSKIVTWHCHDPLPFYRVSRIIWMTPGCFLLRHLAHF